MYKLTNNLLIETYKMAIEHNINEDFIMILHEEIKRRKSEGIINFHEKDNQKIVV